LSNWVVVSVFMSHGVRPESHGVTRLTKSDDDPQNHDAVCPGRLALTLARLMGGLWCIGVAPEAAWALLVKVALDCMPDLRRRVFVHLVEHYDERYPSKAIAAALGYPTTTTTHALEDMAAHRIVMRHPAKPADEWNISDWALNLHQTPKMFKTIIIMGGYE
jgi:hypothetical protein